MKTLIVLVLTVSSLAIFKSYDFSANELLTKPNCNSKVIQQSPINIHLGDSLYYDERNFRVLATNYTMNAADFVWTALEEERGVGFKGKFGNLTLMKDWAMYKFSLDKIVFRTESAHTIDGQRFSGEVEFIHSIIDDRELIGKYIYPTSNYLVYSVFLYAKPSIDISNYDSYSQLLTYLNLEGFEKNRTSGVISASRDVALAEIIRHDDQLFYEGRLTSGNCEKAWHIINPKYQIISEDQFKNLTSILTKYDFITATEKSNTRTIQAVDASTPIYRNKVNAGDIFIESSTLQLKGNSSFISLNVLYFLGLLMIFI
jgi:hypothetical protein